MLEEDSQNIRRQIRSSVRTKHIEYLKINPELVTHPVYTVHDISEYKRVIFSRFRLGSHHLKIETGRWQRLPRERRVCDCDGRSIQDEEHVTLKCPLTSSTRRKYNVTCKLDKV